MTSAERIRLLSLAEVSAIIGIAESTCKRWAAQRRLPVVKLSNRCLVDEAELNRWIDRHRVAPNSDLEI